VGSQAIFAVSALFRQGAECLAEDLLENINLQKLEPGPQHRLGMSFISGRWSVGMDFDDPGSMPKSRLEEFPQTSL